MPTNTAAWLVGAKATSLVVKSAPYTSPRSDEIVIENKAVAINPADHIKQSMGSMMYPWVNYPFILGSDVAGTVVEIGSGVTRFKVGDRVVGSSVAVDKRRNSPTEGGFQKYTVILAHMASPIPEGLSYEQASVIPLGFATAACGLFEKEGLDLHYPSLHPKDTGKTILIWGGSTSVGSNAIQLARAAGYEVITTASPKNHEYVKRLGACEVFDYRSPTVVRDVVRAFSGKTTGGALGIGPGSAEACLEVLRQCRGDKALSQATYPGPDPLPKRFMLLTIIVTYLSGMMRIWFKARTSGIRYNFIFGTTLYANGVGKAVFEDYLGEALAQGAFTPAPDARVVGNGLESIQEAIEVQKKGVSASKLVVTL